MLFFSTIGPAFFQAWGIFLGGDSFVDEKVTFVNN